METTSPNVTLKHRPLKDFETVTDAGSLNGEIRVFYHRFGLETFIRNSTELYKGLREFLATYWVPVYKGREPKPLRRLGRFEAYTEDRRKNGQKNTFYVLEWVSHSYVIRLRSRSLDPDSHSDITVEVLGSWDMEEPFIFQVKLQEKKAYSYTWIQAIGEGSPEDVSSLASSLLARLSKALLGLEPPALRWRPLWGEIYVLYEDSLEAEKRILDVLKGVYRRWGLRSRSRFGDFLIGIGKQGNREAVSWISTPLRVDFLSMFIKSYKKKGWRDGYNSANKLELRISFKKSRTGERIPWMVALESGASFLASIVSYAGVPLKDPAVAGLRPRGFIPALPRAEVVKALTLQELRGDLELFSYIMNKYKGHLDEMALALLEFIASKGVISSRDLEAWRESHEFLLKGKLTVPSRSTLNRRIEKLEALGLITNWRGGGSKETKNLWYYAFNSGVSFRDVLEAWKVKQNKKKKIKGDLERAKAFLQAHGYSKKRAEAGALIWVLVVNGARSVKAIQRLLKKMGWEASPRTIQAYLSELARLGLIESRERYRKGRSGKRVRHVFYYAHPLPSGEEGTPYVGGSMNQGGGNGG